MVGIGCPPGHRRHRRGLFQPAPRDRAHAGLLEVGLRDGLRHRSRPQPVRAGAVARRVRARGRHERDRRGHRTDGRARGAAASRRRVRAGLPVGPAGAGVARARDRARGTRARGRRALTSRAGRTAPGASRAADTAQEACSVACGPCLRGGRHDAEHLSRARRPAPLHRATRALASARRSLRRGGSHGPNLGDQHAGRDRQCHAFARVPRGDPGCGCRDLRSDRRRGAFGRRPQRRVAESVTGRHLGSHAYVCAAARTSPGGHRLPERGLVVATLGARLGQDRRPRVQSLQPGRYVARHLRGGVARLGVPDP